MVLKETKVTDQSYFHYILGYDVVCLTAIATDACGAQGGVGLVVWYQPKEWSVKSTHFHGPNRVSCNIVAGGKRTPLLGAYLSPSTLEHLPDLEEDLTQFQEQDPIM